MPLPQSPRRTCDDVEKDTLIVNSRKGLEPAAVTERAYTPAARELGKTTCQSMSAAGSLLSQTSTLFWLFLDDHMIVDNSDRHAPPPPSHLSESDPWRGGQILPHVNLTSPLSCWPFWVHITLCRGVTTENLCSRPRKPTGMRAGLHPGILHAKSDQYEIGRGFGYDPSMNILERVITA